jgi:regulatory protein
MKQWGRVKIVQQLKLQKVSGYNIKKALTEIDGDEYYATLQNLAAKKWAELKSEKQPPIRKNKTYRYLAQKGYEGGLISDVLKELSENK